MDKVASAYVLIIGKRDRERVDRLLKNYEVMAGDYMDAEGLLTRVMDYCPSENNLEKELSCKPSVKSSRRGTHSAQNLSAASCWTLGWGVVK